jgi:hypothetical protein
MKYIFGRLPASMAEVLNPDENKMMVISSLQWLIQNLQRPGFTKGRR